MDAENEPEPPALQAIQDEVAKLLLQGGISEDVLSRPHLIEAIARNGFDVRTDQERTSQPLRLV